MTNEELERVGIQNELETLLSQARSGKLKGLVVAIKDQGSWSVGQIGRGAGNNDVSKAVNLIKHSIKLSASQSPPLHLVSKVRS